MYGQTCESVKRECDRLKRDLEDIRYQQELESERQYREQVRERENRQREREEARRRAMPSNRLYHGEVTDFREAVRCHVAACEQEIVSPLADDDEEMRRTVERCNKTMSESILRAQKAGETYDRITRETHARIAEALRAAGLEEWATCLESGDYSSMAI